MTITFTREVVTTVRQQGSFHWRTFTTVEIISCQIKEGTVDNVMARPGYVHLIYCDGVAVIPANSFAILL